MPKKKPAKKLKKKPARKSKKKPVKKGRPTRYKSSFCKRLIAFFDVEPFRDVELPHYFNDAKHRVKWKDYKRVACKLPTLRDFAKSIKVPISTMYGWLEEKELEITTEALKTAVKRNHQDVLNYISSVAADLMANK